MNTQEQAYIEGFVKRASEYGFSQAESAELLKTSGLGAKLRKLLGRETMGDKVHRYAGAAKDALLTPEGLGTAGGGLAGAGVGGALGTGGSMISQTFSDEMDGMTPAEKIKLHLSRGLKGSVAGGAVGAGGGYLAGKGVHKFTDALKRRRMIQSVLDTVGAE